MKLRVLVPSLTLLAAVVNVVGPSPAARAVFPGQNGRIAYATSFARTPQIYTIRPDGTALRQVTHVHEGHAAVMPEWSPDGTRIAFVRDGRIWVMNADGSGKHGMTAPAFEDDHPSWSPDGSRILFSRCSAPFGFVDRCHIMVMNADGSGLAKILGGAWKDGAPVYSPNGRRIAFHTDRGGFVSAVRVMNADGTELNRLTDPDLEAYGPDWSPDGTHILFSTNADRPQADTWVMRADGSHQEQLTHFGQAGDDSPIARFSPDGRRIALLGPRLNPDSSCCWDLYLMNADGSDLHPIENPHPGIVDFDWGAKVSS